MIRLLVLLFLFPAVASADNFQALLGQLSRGTLTQPSQIVIAQPLNAPALNPYLLAEAQKSRYDALSAKEDVITGMLGGPANPSASNTTHRAIQRYWLNVEEYYARPNR